MYLPVRGRGGAEGRERERGWVGSGEWGGGEMRVRVGGDGERGRGGERGERRGAGEGG